MKGNLFIKVTKTLLPKDFYSERSNMFLYLLDSSQLSRINTAAILST